VPGAPPRDIDVVVVGRRDPDEVYAAAAEAERDLGREVNVTVASKHDWDFPPTQFLATIRTGSKIEIERAHFDARVVEADREHARAIVDAVEREVSVG
jgi:hypothetical protein